MQVKPKLYKTRNIKKTLAKYASDVDLSITECDFRLKGVTNYIKTIHDQDFKLFNTDIEHYTKKELILNEHIELQQLYTIEARPAKNSLLALDYTIELGEYATDPKIVLHPNSKIPYKSYQAKEIYLLLKRELNKIKARHGLLINLFENKMTQNLKAFVKYLYAGKFKKKVKLSLFDGIEPEVAREGQLILLFEKKKDEHKIVEVEENETLVVYKKPEYGHNGFNAYGKQVDDIYSSLHHDLDTKIDPTSIAIQEDEDAKYYKSKLKGYVHFDGENLSVNNKVRVATISRVEESLAQHQDNNIEVHISQHDTNKDSIGEGVELTSETIKVHGHVGAHAKLMSINLEIEGATHQSSSQYAKFAKINRHKGMLRCHQADIKLLEGGEVHATKVRVDACLNGTIYAQDVTIGQVKSNLKVYASNSIKIRLVSGENNLFKINYEDVPVLKRKLELLDEELQEFKDLYSENKKHSSSEAQKYEEKITLTQQQRDEIIHSAQKATIEVSNAFRGINSIVFTYDKDHELIYRTSAKQYKTFYIQQKDDTITLHPTSISLSL